MLKHQHETAKRMQSPQVLLWAALLTVTLLGSACSRAPVDQSADSRGSTPTPSPTPTPTATQTTTPTPTAPSTTPDDAPPADDLDAVDDVDDVDASDRDADRDTDATDDAADDAASDDANSVPAQQPVARPGQDITLEDLPWPPRLGVRVEHIDRTFPLIDRLVLVPDVATLVDEIGKWSLPGGRWPVLIEDDHLAPMFVRRFQPAEVIRRTSVGLFPNARQERQQRIVETIARIWGGEATTHDQLPALYQQLGHIPPGLVITSVDDSAWPAALILAAGRGQVIAWMDRGYNRPNQIANEEMTVRFIDEVHALLELCGYPYRELGDAIEAITICRDVAGRMRSDVHQDPTAMTDLLGRSEPTERYAFAGWIFGDETRATYMAMCSLFLDRNRYWLANTYQPIGGFAAYGFDEAGPALEAAGHTVVASLPAESLIQNRWMNLLSGGISADVILMNSKGNADFFDVGNDDRLRPFDVPMLNEPAALQFVHSWAFRSPQQWNTVGAQWLDRGVYAAVGSMQEPFLSAFLPPNVVVDRLTKYVPFLIACRHWAGRQWIHRPWKVNTIGDPLMMCRAEPLERRSRAAEYGEHLHDRARDLLEQAGEAPTLETLRELLHTTHLLGRDELVLNVWRLAQQHGLATETAALVLPAAFRLRDQDVFMAAYRLVPQPSEQQKIMLWHLMYPRLGENPDAEVLSEFARSLRSGGEVWDLERIHERIRRVLSPAHLTRLVERALETTTNERNQNILRRMLR